VKTSFLGGRIRATGPRGEGYFWEGSFGDQKEGKNTLRRNIVQHRTRKGHARARLWEDRVGGEITGYELRRHSSGKTGGESGGGF